MQGKRQQKPFHDARVGSKYLSKAAMRKKTCRMPSEVTLFVGCDTRIDL
jgi:hypothetical protein